MIRVINGYMNSKSISFELQSKVRKYLEYIIKKDTKKQEETNILDKLNKALKKEVIMEAYGKILSQTKLFTKNFSSSTIENLSFCLKQLTFSPEEFIYKVKLLKFIKKMRFLKANSRDENSIYILEKGQIEEINEYSKGDINNTIKIIKVIKICTFILFICCYTFNFDESLEKYLEVIHFFLMNPERPQSSVKDFPRFSKLRKMIF